VAATAIDAGLPKSSIFASLDWVAAGNLTAVPGITSQIAASVTNVYLLTYSDSFKYVYLASIAFGCVSLSAPNFEETLIATIKQGGTAKAAIRGVNKMINSMINPIKFLVKDWFPRGEMAEEERHIGNKFVGLRGRDLRCLNRKFVSRQGASLDAGTHVNSLDTELR
jgi:hypothetical protein